MTNLSPTALALMNLHRGGWERVAEAVDALIAVTQEARMIVTLEFMEKIDVALAPFTDPAPKDQPHVLAAEGMLAGNYVVARHGGESDERYNSRCELVDLLLASAKANQ